MTSVVSLAGKSAVLRALFASDLLQSGFVHGVHALQACLPGTNAERRIAAALAAARSCPRPESVPGRIVLLNAGLAAGGAERQIVNTLSGLKEASSHAGIESVRLIVERLPADGSRSFHLDELRGRGIQVDELSLATENPAANGAAAAFAALPRSQTAHAQALYAKFRELRPSVVHAWQDRTNIVAGLAAMRAGVPRIVLFSRNVSPRNFLYWRPYMRPAYRALIAAGARVYNNSAAGARDYAEWLGIDASRVAVIRNGLYFGPPPPDGQAKALRRSLGIPLQAPMVGSIFRFWPEKRPLLWLQAVASLHARKPDMHFLLAGWGPLRQEIISRASRLGLGERLHLIEADVDVASMLNAIDVFMLTSRFEGTPNVVIEAQHFGLPVVATAAGGTAEAVQLGRTGWIADARPEALAEMVLRVIADPEMRARARAEGPAFVAERFGMGRMMAETLAAYGLADEVESGRTL